MDTWMSLIHQGIWNMETNHDKFMRLLKQNKLRIARKKLIEKYRVEFDISIEEVMFYDVEKSHRIVGKVYTINNSLKEYKAFKDYSDVMNELEKIKEELEHVLDKKVFFMYLTEINDPGGLNITLAESWSIIQKITIPSLDIIVTDEDFTFGFCVEVDEHNYLLFNWSHYWQGSGGGVR
jgi:hypothetical protein